MTENNERAHAECGGSTAHRWLRCPASVVRMRDLPPAPPNPAALDGTRVHEFVEIALRNFLNFKVTGEWEGKEDFSDIVSVDDLVMITIKEYVQTVWDKVFLESITGKVWGMEDNFVISEELGMSGYVDFWMVYKDAKGKKVLVILDFKNGYKYVDIKNNAQLAFYAVGFREYLLQNGKDIDYVRCAIYQPNNKGIENSAYREIKYTTKQLDSWKSKFVKSATQIKNNRARAKAGEHCLYCGYKPICPEHIKYLNKTTGINLLADDMVTTPTLDIGDDQIVKIVTHGDLLTDYVKAVKALALQRMINGESIISSTGEKLKLVESEGKRELKESKEVVEFLISCGLTDTEFYNKKLKGISALEKKLPKEKVKTLNTFITRGESKYSVVPENELHADKQLAIDTTAMLAD